jgi:hypothetical protein
MWIKTEKQRPNDQQLIFYYFKPFGSYHKGRYNKEHDMVYSPGAFTSMIPEVPYWMPIPPLPEEE